MVWFASDAAILLAIIGVSVFFLAADLVRWIVSLVMG